MTEINRALILHAINQLLASGQKSCAEEVSKLLAKADNPPREPCWLTDENLDGIVRALYPPNPEWTEELKARHFRHIRIALKLNSEFLNEDVKEVLSRALQKQTV